MTEPTISYIIPVKNGAGDIDNCLNHIEAEMNSGDEIIVIDNGSTDDTINIVRKHPEVTLLEHPELTIGGLRNRGAKNSSGSLLAFVDSDCLLQPGWRQAVTQELADSKVHATGAICALPLSPTWVERAWSASHSKTSRSVEYIPSANLIVKRVAFENLNGFDENLVTDEDYDIGHRIIKAGGLIIDSPKVSSIHLGNSKTMAQFIKRQRWHATSILDTLAKDGWDKPMVMTALFMITCLIATSAFMAVANIGLFTLAGIALIFIAPVLTAAHRVLRNGDIFYFPHLIILYFLFYWVRSIIVLKGMLK